MRKAWLLSTTTAPRLTASGSSSFAMSSPAAPSTMSQPSKASGQASSITICSPRNSTVLPAERALASSLSLPTGNSCSLRHSSIWVPTAPVAPKIATVYCFMLPPLKVMAFARTPSRPIIVASVYKNEAGTKPAPSKRNRNETPRRRFLRHDPKNLPSSRYFLSAARVGSTGVGASKSETFTMPFSSEKAR